jgi:hypothetical protein
MKLMLICMAGLMTGAAWAAPVVLGPETALDADPRQEFPRLLNFRPADGQIVGLNPPRMSWPWYPGSTADGRACGRQALHTADLQYA